MCRMNLFLGLPQSIWTHARLSPQRFHILRKLSLRSKFPSNSIAFVNKKRKPRNVEVISLIFIQWENRLYSVNMLACIQLNLKESPAGGSSVGPSDNLLDEDFDLNLSTMTTNLFLLLPSNLAFLSSCCISTWVNMVLLGWN